MGTIVVQFFRDNPPPTFRIQDTRARFTPADTFSFFFSNAFVACAVTTAHWERYFYIVQVVDGWELNGEVFPSEMDHRLPLKQRISEFCGKNIGVKRSFTSSQNAAVIRYRIPKPGKGFTLFARFLKNPRREWNRYPILKSTNFKIFSFFSFFPFFLFFFFFYRNLHTMDENYESSILQYELLIVLSLLNLW